MQYLNAHSAIHLPQGLRAIPTRYWLLTALIILALLELSSARLILLTLVLALGFSLVERVNKLTCAKPATPASIVPNRSFDGGAFTLQPTATQPRDGVRIVCDGGSFERSHLK